MSSLTLTGAGPEAGTFNPASIAGLTVWYKADVGTSTTTDGVAISQWDDQSGNAQHLTQATGAKQPVFKAAFQNGLPVVQFTAASSQSMAATGVSVAQPDTVFAVCKTLDTASTRILFDGQTTRQSAYMAAGGVMHGQATNDVASSVTTDTTNFHQLSLIVNGASSAMWWDAASATLGDLGAGALTSLLLSQNNPNTGWWNGYIAEFLIYNSSLSVGNRQAVEAYLKSKWNTP